MDDGRAQGPAGGTLPGVTRRPAPADRPPDSPQTLRPGATVVAHPPGRLVVADDRRRVGLPGTTTTRALLDRLAAQGVPPPGSQAAPEVWRAWSRLRDAGLLVGADTLAQARLAARDHGTALADATAHALGDEAAGALRGRLAVTVALRAPVELAPTATAALSAAGLRVTGPRARGALHLVVADVAPDPRVVAPLMHSGTPHLTVVRDVSGVTVGPFVVPGHSACTGCLEASQADQDPDGGVVRLLRARQLRRTVLPHDPAVWALALAEAARDVTVWAAGEQPRTWSATRTWRHAGGEERVALRRHARCGCAWDALAAG